MVMMLFTRKNRMPEPGEALPGRDAAMTVPERHDVLGTPLKPPFPEGIDGRLRPRLLLGRRAPLLGGCPGVYTTAVGYAGGHTPNPTYEEVCSGRTGHAEAVLVVFDPHRQISLRRAAQAFWEGHDPTQGMRQGNDVGTQYRSAIYTVDEEQPEAAPTRSRAAYQAAPGAARPWRDHDRDRARRPVLLRRALPPAVPLQEPGRLLRPGRHGRLLPDRARDGLRRKRRTATESPPARWMIDAPGAPPPEPSPLRRGVPGGGCSRAARRDGRRPDPAGRRRARRQGRGGMGRRRRGRRADLRALGRRSARRRTRARNRPARPTTSRASTPRSIAFVPPACSRCSR